MDDCPLVRLANNLKILQKFEQSGQVAIPLTDWLRFFEALTFINRDSSPQDIYCTIVEGYLVFSKTPFKKKPDAAPKP
ncbi:MAG TPA: hypothetical protein VFV58_11940 [Blastocatellia bacterium]|jgi:hypothetical protein|nr:hypothetical protein [Blastocatellia bacterium]